MSARDTNVTPGSASSNDRRSWRLRSRLTIAIVVLFVGIFVLQAVSHFQYLDDRKDSRIESMQQVTRTITAVFDGFTHDLESFSLSTTITLGDARIPVSQEVPEGNRTTVNNYLQHLFDSYGLLRAVFITDTDGRVVYSHEGGNAGVNLAGRSYITELQRGADFFWSEGVVGLQSGRTTVSHSRKIVTPEGETTGFLVFAFYPDQLISRLPAGLIDEGHLALIDQQGGILFQLPAPGPEDPNPQLSGWADLAAARGGDEVVLRSEPIPLNTRDRYGSLIGLEGVDWVVGFSMPASAIEGSATAVFQRNLLVTLLLLAAGLAVMLFIADRLSRPLAALAKAAAAIARGEPVDDLTRMPRTDADVATLATTMEFMRQAIATREEQLQAQATVLESIERVGESLASELDLDRAISAVTEAGIRMTDAEASLFLYRQDSDSTFEPIGVTPSPGISLALDDPVVTEVLEGATLHIPDLQARAQRRGNRVNGATPPQGEEDATAGPRSVLGIPVRSPSGAVAGGLFFMHSAESSFSSQHQRLARGLARWAGIVLENARLYRETHELLEMLRKANADKDEFLAVVSHELRTPITTIYGGTRLLSLRRAKLTEAAVDDMITSVSEESERLYRLVEDLLAIARTEMSEKVEREPVAVAALIDQAVSQFGRNHHRTIDVRVADDLPPALAEPAYFIQVVTNLLSNADKYSPADQPIEVEAERQAQEIWVRVKDHGPGVAEEELPQIFESFYRSRTTSGKASGKGLGLTVCQRLVDALSGRIWARNRPEGGLEVSFTLELTELSPSTEPRDQVTAASE